jgi:glutamate synthase (NADPH/NADH) small chain
MDGMKKVPVREQEPKVRATNFEEVCYGYNEEEAVAEASRCLNCKNARCVQGCPVRIDIPAFVKEVKEGNYAEAAKVIGRSSALPAVCGRVCPQESQCEGQCVRGIKGEAVSIGKLERFVAERTGSFRKSRRRQTASRSLSSVPVRPVLPVQVILRNLDTR